MGHAGMTTRAVPDPQALMALLGRFAGRRILCVGDLMVDKSTYGEVKRISPEAPVPVVRVVHETSALGGAGNVVRNLAALSGNVHFVTIVGDDAAAGEAGKMLRELRGVDSYIAVSDTRATTIKNRFFSSDGHQLLRADRESVTALSAAETADLVKAATAEMATCDAVILSDYAKGVVTAELAAGIIAAAHAAKKPVVIDPKGTDYLSSTLGS